MKGWTPAEVRKFLLADLEKIHPRGRTSGEMLTYVLTNSTADEIRLALLGLMRADKVYAATRRHPTCGWITMTEYFALKAPVLVPLASKSKGGRS